MIFHVSLHASGVGNVAKSTKKSLYLFHLERKVASLFPQIFYSKFELLSDGYPD